ncbi:AMP-binding protein [Marinovum sp.]|uniref:AMP-binding protein n=1 Tax=Marinovum sp. TaxID=2024839 RepID=UPI003A8D1B79
MKTEGFLAPGPANHVPLTPVDFLTRTLAVRPGDSAVVWRDRSWSWAEFAGVVREMADWLRGQGIGAGDVVSVICTNRPEMLAAHYAVPLLGGVLNSVNTRLDAEVIAYILDHSESRLLLADPSCSEAASDGAGRAGVPLFLLAEDGQPGGADLGFLAAPAATSIEPSAVSDEWMPIALNYTSGTTGNPKGVVLTHRGAYLNALGNVMALGFTRRTVNLWTLPMFHCNGWCHTWAVTAAGGVHVCLDKVDPEVIFDLIETRGVTHMSCAPVVLYMLLNSAAGANRTPAARVTVASGGAAPTSALISQLDALGFEFTHLYGLTESYGPATLRALSEDETGLDGAARAALLSRQGLEHVTASQAEVLDENGQPVAWDGETLGEIALRGNTVMAGYLNDAEATERAFRSGWLHTGDLAVRHADGQIEIRDRAKDIIISGGENISSLEIENVLHQHPAVLLASVVAQPDDKWGEIPCAFVELRDNASVDAEELRGFCRARLAHFKVPRRFEFTEIPKTATGKVQKYLLRARVSNSAGAA